MMKRVAGWVIGATAAFAVAAATPSDMSAQCANCDRCGGGHEAPAGSGNAWGSPHTPCIGGLWCDGHPPCGVTLNPTESFRHDYLERLIDRANDGDFVAVLTMLRTFHGDAYVNEERSALQVRTLATCRDAPETVIAHVTLDATQLAIASDWQRPSPAGVAVDDQQ